MKTATTDQWKRERSVSTNRSYVEVAVALPVFKTLTYGLPQTLCTDVAPGQRVLVPVKSGQVTGYVLSCFNHTNREAVKDIIDIMDDQPLFPASMIPFFRWTSDYYLHPIGEVLKAALPGGLSPKAFVEIRLTEAGRQALGTPAGLSTHRRAVLNALLKGGGLSLKALSASINGKVSSNLLMALENAGLVSVSRKLPPGRTRPKTARYVRTSERRQAFRRALSKPRQRVLEYLATQGEVSLRRLNEDIPGAGRLVKKMAEAGLLELFDKDLYRDPFGEPIETQPCPHHLTGEQSTVLRVITSGFSRGFRTYLLHGVTGSGKTEVYMHAATDALDRGFQALVLVPEIALISQTERRFRARFGECVALLHSGLSQGERFDQWMRIVNGRAQIAIGARSAIFAPFDRLGLIIVDEEHDESYKQETGLRYNARDLAVIRAKQLEATALLGTATPSVQSYENVLKKKFIGLELKKRIEDRDLPEVTVIDLKPKKPAQRAKPFITAELKAAIQETLDRGEQTLLFLNRRGFASCPACLSCGAPVRCDHCDVTMTLHRRENTYKCHYCGHTAPHTLTCPCCGNAKIIPVGFGTEKVHEKIEALFPEARVTRMDQDTTRRKGSLVKMLGSLKKGEIDILVGTQMVAKGHHYPNITLVGILCADLSLNFPDYRSGERTFQILAQVAGRAGRGTRPGRVILQTFNPEHFCITTARDQDYGTYFQKEIRFRESAGYPPFCRLIQVTISGKDKGKTARWARRIGALCRQSIVENKTGNAVEALGPVTAPLAKLKDRYRWHLLLKGTQVSHLHQTAERLRQAANREMAGKGVRLIIDVDPMSML